MILELKKIKYISVKKMKNKIINLYQRYFSSIYIKFKCKYPTHMVVSNFRF